MDISKVRKNVMYWNHRLTNKQPTKSSNVSTYQNQVLKKNPSGLIIHKDRETELLALALGILQEIKGRYPKAFIQADILRRQKHDDYNQGVDLDDYFPFGLLSYVQEINKKNLRLVSLTTTGNAPKNEAITDTLLDMINYCAFAYEKLNNGK